MYPAPHMESIDLSSDVGERPGAEGLAEDFALLEVITSANVACGGHSGDRASMITICEVAVGNGVAIGAQVSYVDREGFGRRQLDVPRSTLVEQLREQWGQLSEAAQGAGGQVDYMRPHGALYNAALVDVDVATAVLDATPSGTPVLCVAGTVLARLAAERGHPVAPEIFADRAVTNQGLLVPRGTPGAVIDDPDHVAERLARWLRTGHLESHSGQRVAVVARSICVHSDTPGAVQAAVNVRQALEAAGARLRPFARDEPGSIDTRSLPSHHRPAESGLKPREPKGGLRHLRAHQFGERAVLVDVEGGTPADVAAWARAVLGPGLVDAVPAAECVLLTFTEHIEAASVAAILRHTPAPSRHIASGTASPVTKAHLVTIDVRYEGADLAAVASALGISIEEVIARHSQATFEVAFFGFAPGFAYLSGLPAELHLPRRATPRTSVPAGAVAIASAYTAVYPRSSPGGWHLLGHTDAVMFDPRRTPPTLLTPGTKVRFRPV